jgi:hypothetical protein
MEAHSMQRTFSAVLEPRRGGGIAISVPFDPAAAWGDKDRHYVAGSIESWRVRGTLTAVGDGHFLLLGPAWCRDPRVGPGSHVTVTLAPEGPSSARSEATSGMHSAGNRQPAASSSH